MKHRKRTRREFLNEVGGCAAGAVGSGVLGSMVTACGGDALVDPNSNDDDDRPPPEPPVAVVSGPEELIIPDLGGLVEGTYDSGGSQGPIGSREWTLDKENDPFSEFPVSLGGDVTARRGFHRAGSYTVKLEAANSGGRDVAELTTVVHPPALPGTDYPIMAFMTHEYVDPNSPSIQVLYLMDPQTGRITELARYAGFYGQRITLEPSGGRLATDFGSRNLSVKVYNLLTDELTDLGPGWMPAWNPQKEGLVVFMERNRLQYSREPIIKNVDTSQSLYVAGSTPSMDVSGRFPSWSPDGEQIALAEANFFITDQMQIYGTPDKRLATYTGFWNGDAPVRTQVPSEEQLVAFLDSRGDNNMANFYSMNMGINGACWSPDGEWIAYLMMYGFGEFNSQAMLVKSRVDRTGDIEVLVEENVFGVSWSPDGNYVLSSTTGGKASRLFKVPSAGGSKMDISGSGSGRVVNDFSLVWCH